MYFINNNSKSSHYFWTIESDAVVGVRWTTFTKHIHNCQNSLTFNNDCEQLD